MTQTRGVQGQSPGHFNIQMCGGGATTEEAEKEEAVR